MFCRSHTFKNKMEWLGMIFVSNYVLNLKHTSPSYHSCEPFVAYVYIVWGDKYDPEDCNLMYTNLLY